MAPREIVLTKHARSMMAIRQIELETIRPMLIEKAPIKVEEQDKDTYRARYELSRKYDLVVVFRVLIESLLIITAYKTSRKWQV